MVGAFVSGGILGICFNMFLLPEGRYYLGSSDFQTFVLLGLLFALVGLLIGVIGAYLIRKL